MKVDFILEKTKSTIKDKESGESREIEYYILKRQLVNGDVFIVPIKKEKAQILSMSLSLEKR